MGQDINESVGILDYLRIKKAFRFQFCAYQMQLNQWMIGLN